MRGYGLRENQTMAYSTSAPPFLITQAMMYTTTVPTYLSGDWYRDWGSVEQYHRLVSADQAPDAAVEQGVIRVNGWSRPGPIRALP
jgi:arabinosyltransferase A